MVRVSEFLYKSFSRVGSYQFMYIQYFLCSVVFQTLFQTVFMSNILFVLFLFVGHSISNFYEFPRFWTNTGFCPIGNVSKALLSQDEEINIRLLGSLPNNGIKRVRIHWLLELIEFSHYREHGIPVFDFSKLDKLLDSMIDSNLSVGFELMGNPGQVFRNNSMWKMWDDLVFQVGKRYIGE